jgi:hypothetical protein
MLAAERQLATLAAIGIGALILFPKLAGWLTRQGVSTAGSVIRETGTGLVIGIGEVVGIPATDAAKCEAAVAAGEWYEASKYCPAGTFLRSASGAVYDTVTGAFIGESAPTGHAAIVTIREAGYADEWGGGVYGDVPIDLPGISPGVEVNLSDVQAA